MDTKEKRRGPQRVTGRPSPQKPVRRQRKLRDADVVYTPPKPFKRGKFLLHLATVAAVVVAVVLGMSIFFKVENVQVSGNKKYSAWEVSEASGIEMGSNLMTISRAQIGGSVISNLPYVDTVRVGINLPDTVNIEITELDVVYSVSDSAGNWWLMNTEGKIVEGVNEVAAKDYTQVLGLRLADPVVGQQAIADEPERPTIPLDVPEGETTEDGELVTEPVTEPVIEPGATEETLAVGITGAQRLETAMSVLQILSTNSISGLIDSVDVSELTAIELWYDERFQINMGDATRVDYKIEALKATVDQMESYERGQLDISFVNWPDKVGYTPFE